MQSVFTTNDAEITRSTGLYIKERTPPASVRGVSLNAVGVTGACVRGPVGKIVEITSAARFKDVYGERDYGSGGTLIGSVWKSLLNKPFGKVYVCRAANASDVAASFTLETAAGGAGTAIVRIDASSVGAWGNNVQFCVTTASDGVSTHWDLVVKYLGTTKRYKNLNTSTGVDNTLTVLGSDDANWITITKLASGRPVNNANGVDGAVSATTGTDLLPYTYLGQIVTAFTSALGLTNTLVATDFTATTTGPIELLNNYKGIGICFVADPLTGIYAALKIKILAQAALTNDRLWLVGANDETVVIATAVTDASAMVAVDRIVYCYNHAYTQDPTTATEMLTRPEDWVASILSQTDADIHPGEEDCKKYCAGVTRLYNESYTRENYITLKEGGISAFEKDNGFALVEGVNTYAADGTGKEQITRRRMADYLILGLSGFLKHSVKKKNLASRRMANKGAVSAWLRDLAKAERIVDKLSDGSAAFVVDTEVLNTDAGRAAGVERMLVRAKLIGHMLSVVLETEIGTGVTIQVS